MRLGPSSWKVTAPSTWPFSPFDFQTIRSSGTCSRIVASQVRCDQNTCALKVSLFSSCASTVLTFFMKLGNEPNSVHWL